MTSFDEKVRSALAKAQTMAKPMSQSETVVDGTVPSASKQNTANPKAEGNPLIKVSKFDFRPLYSRVDINCDKWLMTMSEESRAKLEHPPSLDDGIDFQTEQEIRFLGCELIQEGAILLKLPQTAAATGQILFHRFYYQRSFLKYWFQHTVMACLLLASKIEEAPRRPRDIYNIFHRLEQLHNLKNKGRSITKETTAQLKPADINQKYMNAKTHVLNTEKRMMSCLGFVVHVKHPHKLIISYIFILGYGGRNDFIQKSWSYMNDGLRTDMFVRYKPETIACACIFVAARTVEEPIPLPSQPFHWFELFDASDRDVYTIANQLMTLYARQKPVNMNRLVHILDKMREEKETAELAEKARQAALIAAKLAEIKEKREESVDKTSRKRKSISPSRSRTRSPRRKHSPKKRRDSLDRKYKSNGRERDRRDDKDRRDRDRRDNRDDRKRRSRDRRERDRDRDYDRKDRSKMRSDAIYETLKSRQREVPIKPRK